MKKLVKINETMYNCVILWGEETLFAYVNKDHELIVLKADEITDFEKLRNDICINKIYSSYELNAMIKDKLKAKTLDEMM